MKAVPKAEPLADRVRRWRANRMQFRREEIILPEGQRLGDVVEPWQTEDFEALDAAERHLHAYLERARGHAKTDTGETEIVTDLTVGPADRFIVMGAADQDQISLMTEGCWAKIQRNKLLRPLFKRTKYEITNRVTRSYCRAIASDAPTSFGLRPDRLVADELDQWQNPEFWYAMFSALIKKPHARALVLATAGWDKGSIAWSVREMARTDPAWYFSSRGAVASWITDAQRAVQQRALPEHVYKRLHLNIWSEGAGAFLSFAEVDGVFGAIPREEIDIRALGLDLGLSKDKAVVSRVGSTPSGLIVVECLATYAPGRHARVDLQEVEAYVTEVALALGCPVALDPWQGILMGERMRSRGIEVLEFNFSATSRQKLFGRLLDLIRTGRLRAEEHAELRKELLGLEVEQTATGWKVDHRANAHDDHVVSIALGIAALAAITLVDLNEMSLEERQNLRPFQRYLAGTPEPYLGWANYIEPDYGPRRDPWSLDPDLGYCDGPL